MCSLPGVLFLELRMAALLEHKASLQPEGLRWAGVTRSLMASLGTRFLGWRQEPQRDDLQRQLARYNPSLLQGAHAQIPLYKANVEFTSDPEATNQMPAS